jgi:hypothetical protein
MLEGRPRKAGRGRQIFCYIATSKPALEPDTCLIPSLLPRQKKYCSIDICMLSHYKIIYI